MAGQVEQDVHPVGTNRRPARSRRSPSHRRATLDRPLRGYCDSWRRQAVAPRRDPDTAPPVRAVRADVAQPPADAMPPAGPVLWTARADRSPRPNRAGRPGGVGRLLGVLRKSSPQRCSRVGIKFNTEAEKKDGTTDEHRYTQIRVYLCSSVVPSLYSLLRVLRAFVVPIVSFSATRKRQPTGEPAERFKAGERRGVDGRAARSRSCPRGFHWPCLGCQQNTPHLGKCTMQLRGAAIGGLGAGVVVFLSQGMVTRCGKPAGPGRAPRAARLYSKDGHPR
jgi:hypothetical protein